MLTRRQPDFKKALSTLYRLKKAEDKKHYENWSHSSSSWWQWQTNWWEPYYETSPQRWSDHWLNGETCLLSVSTIHLRYESQQELNATFIVIISVTADSSLLSPTVCVNRIPPETAIHEQIWLRKSVYNDKYTFNTFIETTVDNNKNDATHMDMRNMQNWAHLHAVFSVFVWFIHHTTWF